MATVQSSLSGNATSKGSNNNIPSLVKSGNVTPSDELSLSRESSISDMNTNTNNNNNESSAKPTSSSTLKPTPASTQFKSLKDRSKVPSSFYLSLVLLFLLQVTTGTYQIIFQQFQEYTETLQQFLLSSSCLSIQNSLLYSMNTIKTYIASFDPSQHTIAENIKMFLIGIFLSSIINIFFIAPFRAGMWTGQRAKKHKIHRYFGLLYLFQYGYGWVYFAKYYDQGYEHSLLPHMITLNGLVQVHSAYFSFKVLPESKDAGYISDKAVLSRTFIHENSYFQLLCAFGSFYYIPSAVASLQSTLLGKCVEHLFLFYPYVFIRPWFPITSFKDAGTGNKGRSLKNQRFYEMSTTAIKIFYLWSKYFLAFYINFLCFLNLTSEEDMKFIRGLFLLNVGTVSLGIFLHTLRFRKVLPPQVTMSVYLVQIYLTFSAIPFLKHLFLGHKALVGLCLGGMICNMTRNRYIHALWCVACHYLLVCADIEW